MPVVPRSPCLYLGDPNLGSSGPWVSTQHPVGRGTGEGRAGGPGGKGWEAEGPVEGQAGSGGGWGVVVSVGGRGRARGRA